MKIVVQRVKQASVSVEGKIVGQIGAGLVLLIGIHQDDQESDADWLAHKIVNLRIFSDENQKMNHSIKDSQGAVLCISQFTLFADYKKGNRPSFITAAPPSLALPLLEYFQLKLKDSGLLVEKGQFGADMQVNLTNDGPVTIVLDSFTKS